MSIESQRLDTDDYEALFLTDTPMFDTRAPIEFKKGAFPYVQSLPLMTDIERAKVGTSYKRDGQEAAIKLGHRLVSGDTKDERMALWIDFVKQNPNGYLYCFRGGLRSHTTQAWLKEAGYDYPLVKGGYKAMRRFLIDRLDSICEYATNSERQEKFYIVAGQTGAAKTDLLLKFDNTIDLEGLANHRGSAFGKRAAGQPSQIDFENSLSINFLRQHHKAPNCPILLEDESHLIGRCALPEKLRTAMHASPIIVVEADLEARVEHSFRNYILQKLAEWEAFCAPGSNRVSLEGKLVDRELSAFELFAQELQKSMFNIRKRLGGVRHQELTTMLDNALEAHKNGDNSLHREWIRVLLREYYDPQYDYLLAKRKERIIFRGSAAEVEAYIQALSAV
ncbi:MAG: tRNA 2-selenouridine synthase [Oleispira sp.]|jgi:tRNA 2-selenouridine synthase